jgi:hypothetical protein
MRLMSAARAMVAPLNCEAWDGRSTTADAGHPGGLHDKYGVVLKIPSGQSSDSVYQRALEALLWYRVFPESRMRYAVCSPDRRIRVGAVIAQRVLFGPLASCGNGGSRS